MPICERAKYSLVFSAILAAALWFPLPEAHAEQSLETGVAIQLSNKVTWDEIVAQQLERKAQQDALEATRHAPLDESHVIMQAWQSSNPAKDAQKTLGQEEQMSVVIAPKSVDTEELTVSSVVMSLLKTQATQNYALTNVEKKEKWSTGKAEPTPITQGFLEKGFSYYAEIISPANIVGALQRKIAQLFSTSTISPHAHAGVGTASTISSQPASSVILESLTCCSKKTKWEDILEPQLQRRYQQEKARQAQIEASKTVSKSKPSIVPTRVIKRVVSALNSYMRGSCVWFVAQKRAVGNWGNARDWLANARRDGFATGSVPRVGAIAWTSRGALGHVAYVIAVNGSQITVQDMNYAGLGVMTTRTTTASEWGGFIY